jgi:hypothetical protein
MDYGVLAGIGDYAVKNLPRIADSIRLRNEDQAMTWQMIAASWAPKRVLSSQNRRCRTPYLSMDSVVGFTPVFWTRVPKLCVSAHRLKYIIGLQQTHSWGQAGRSRPTLRRPTDTGRRIQVPSLIDVQSQGSDLPFLFVATEDMRITGNYPVFTFRWED